MTEPISLSSKRADKSGDCRDASVEDVLKEALERVKIGEIKPDIVYIAFRERKKDEKGKFVRYPSGAAGGSKMELAGLLDRHRSMIWDDE